MRPVFSAIALTIALLIVEVSTAAAQQSDKTYKIGFLMVGAPDFVWPPMEKWEAWEGGGATTLRDTLRDRGYVLGKNLVVELRHARGDVAKLAAEAEALVASGVDVIVSGGTAPTLAAMRVTKRVPIVFNGLGGPVEKGVVASLTHPGGNVTGMAVRTTPPKTMEILKEIAPSTKRAGVLVYLPNNAGAGPDFWPKESALFRVNAAAAGMEYFDMGVNSYDGLTARFVEMANTGDGGILIASDTTLFSWRTPIMEMALRHRLPTVCGQWLGWAAAGCVITYAEDAHARNRGAAAQIDKVLKGTKPADIPVEQQSHWQLIINAKTAKALNLTLPPALLARADEVIE